MPQESLVRNPFLMMLQPELVLAAMERSERLGRLNRHTCRPLDRPVPTQDSGQTAVSGTNEVGIQPSLQQD